MSSSMAIISWIPASKGGRRHPPTGISYRSVARVDGDPEWPTNAWTLVVRPRRAVAQGQFVVADVAFLAPEAPARLLRKGVRFQIFEGTRMVATGQLLGRRAKEPASKDQFAEALLC